MQVKIKNTNECDSCIRKTCSVNDVIERQTFSHFKTERNICPTGHLQTGPSSEQLIAGYIDCNEGSEEKKCIKCGLCKIYCSRNNLDIIDYSFQVDEDFSEIININSRRTDTIMNMLALHYLNTVFDFAANTIVNGTVTYDGYLYDVNNNGYFVEVDSGDDWLESCRRILGDIVLHNDHYDMNTDSGIMVFNKLPKQGTNVYTLIESLTRFPKTKYIKIYATTFSLLRYFAMNIHKNEYKVSDLLFDMTSEQADEYIQKLNDIGFLTEEMKSSLF